MPETKLIVVPEILKKKKRPRRNPGARGFETVKRSWPSGEKQQMGGSEGTGASNDCRGKQVKNRVMVQGENINTYWL